MGDLHRLSHDDRRPAERAVLLTDATLGWWFASGHAVDLVLAILAVELAWLTRRGWRLDDAVLRLGPGALMLLALRGALTGAEWWWVALPLALSFPVHLLDLRRR